LVFVNVNVSVLGAFTATLAGENAAPTVGAAGVTVMGEMQAEEALPAAAGAVLVAPFAVKFTTAVSVLPAESFTTSVKVPAPLTKASTAELLPPDTMRTAPDALHA
jgi:hypothetical protein